MRNGVVDLYIGLKGYRVLGIGVALGSGHD